MNQEIIFDNQRFKVISVSDTTGKLKRQRVENLWGAGALAIFDKKIALVLEERYVKNTWVKSLSIPKGGTDQNENEDKTAWRECEEEMSIKIQKGKSNLLLNVEPDNGILINIIPVYLIQIQKMQTVNHNDGDSIFKRGWFTKNELVEMIKNNEIKDGLTLSALLHLFLFHSDLID